MKTIFLTFAFAALLGFNSIASALKPEGIKEIIQKEITYPEFAKNDNIEGIVLVSFSIADGNIDIESVNASNEDLKDYVIMKLKSLVFKNTEESKINMKFVFKLL